MFGLSRFFRRAVVVAPQITSISPEVKAACLYLSRMSEDRDRVHTEIWTRGLSFGDVRVTDVYASRFEFELVYSKKREFPSERDTILAIQELVSDKRYSHVVLEEDSQGHSVILRIPDNAPSTMEGGGWSGFRGDERYDRRYFIKADLGGYAKFTVHGQAGVQFVADIARKLGYVFGPVVFLKESDVPLEKIVNYCIFWQDPETEKYYTEIKYLSDQVKDEQWKNANKSKVIFEEGSTKVTVLAGAGQPQFIINTLNVPVRRVSEATANMLAAREKIRKEILTRNICGVEECGQEAVTSIYAVRYEMSDSFGFGMSGGSVTLACVSPDHLSKLQSEAGGIRQDTSPLLKEVW